MERLIRSFILFFFLVTYSNLFSQRTVLLENFIQASCQPSAIYNPEIQNFLDTTILQVAVINYHTPYPGEDPMNEQNPEDVQVRLDYYEVEGTPYSIVDGNVFQGGPIGSNFNGVGGWTNFTIENRSKVEPGFAIEVDHTFNESQMEVNIDINIIPQENYSGNYTINVFITERKIEFNEPPGMNGETVFYDVMKARLPNNGSMVLPSYMPANQQISMNTSWGISNFYEKEMLSVVAFIQDEANQEVMQSAKSEPKAIYENDIEIVRIIQPTSTYCNDPVYSTVDPILKIRNRGSGVVDSLIVYTQINEEKIDTSYHSLELDFFGSKDLSLPGIDYNSTPPDTISFLLELPNITNEVISANNELSAVFDTVVDVIDPTMYLLIQPDEYGSEITWEVAKSNGTVIESGGPYEDYNTELIRDTIELTNEGCFYFTIYDSYGDGINTEYGNGYYLIKSYFGDTIAFGNDYRKVEEVHFRSYKIPPTPRFSPENGEINVDIVENVYVRFRESIRYINDSIIEDPDSLFILQKYNASGDTVPVNFRINGSFSTIFFIEDLEYWMTYYLAFPDGMEDYYDNPIPGQSITFTTRAEILNSENPNINELFNVYPNPAKNRLTIESEIMGKLIIYDLLGKAVLSQNIEAQKTTLDVSSLKQGIYFVGLFGKNQACKKKVYIAK